MPRYKITYGLKDPPVNTTDEIEADSLEAAYEKALTRAMLTYDSFAENGEVHSITSIAEGSNVSVTEAMDIYQQYVEENVVYTAELIK